MKQKTLLAFAFFAFALVSFAVQIKPDFNPAFQTARDPVTGALAAVPYGWQRNTWSAYNQPPCSTEVIENGGLKGNSVRMFDVRSKRGSGLTCSWYVAGRCGDTARVSFRARGKGKGRLLMYFANRDGVWSGESSEKSDFVLTENWRNFSASLPILNHAKGETGSFSISFELDCGSEIEVSDPEVEVREGLYRGSENFPLKWTLFGAVADAYEPTPEELLDIPEIFGGAKGKAATLRQHTLDFAPILGKGEKKVGWAFAELDSPIDCDYTIGAAADWWMKYYVNGELVIDTYSRGNIETKYDITNHVVTIPLKKGRNIFAIKLRTGSASSILMLGGPRDLANRSVKVKLSKIDWMEDFNGEQVACTGAPELVQGYPAPGLLTLTGQGVFATDDALAIEQPAGIFPPPEEKATFRTVGVRLQGFANGENAPAASEFELVLAAEDGSDLRLVVKHDPAADTLLLEAYDDGALVKSQSIAATSLPADLLLGGNANGQFVVKATSLSGGESADFAGSSTVFANHNAFRPSLRFRSANAGVRAEVVLDNYCVGQAQEKGLFSNVPHKVDPLPEFDPVAAGWKLVFDEEFDGDHVDWSKWSPRWNFHADRIEVKDGMLKIWADWETPEKKDLKTSSLATRDQFVYGYFEWRGKFKTTHAGWWTAFWLYGHANSNAFYDGFEIDCYEDYFVNARTPDGKPRNQIDHNLHVYNGTTLKSWNFNGPTLNDPLGFHTIGVLWTPFEISYYLDGKLVKSKAPHSPFDSVTFDAFNHAAGVTPLYVIVSGQLSRKPGYAAGRPWDGKWPDAFYTDYVRVYEYPQDEIPQVRWTKTPEKGAAYYGDTLDFSVEVAPSKISGSPIKNVYLFDSGYLLEHKSQPPYDFQVRLTDEYYNMTDYVRPGRQGLVPDFKREGHCYSVFVQDEAGQVAHADPWPLLAFHDKVGKSEPYQGQAQIIPGVIDPAKFDEGGKGVAYNDNTPGDFFPQYKDVRPDTDVDLGGFVPAPPELKKNREIGNPQFGEWLNYTVDVQETGDYAVRLDFSSSVLQDFDLPILLDDKLITFFKVNCRADYPKTVVSEQWSTVYLTKGRHVLTVCSQGPINFRGLTFTLKK